MIDYAVVDKYVLLLSNAAHHERRPLLAKATTSFFRRILQQAKQPWIFYQLGTISVINAYLQRNVCNNRLMAGVKPSGTGTSNVLPHEERELKLVLKGIAQGFLSQLRKNSMLAVEMLFEFPSREIKDAIMNNYSDVAVAAEANPIEQVDEVFGVVPEAQEAEPLRVMQLLAEQKLSKEEQACLAASDEEKWTTAKDQVLIENYASFKELGKQGFDLLSTLVSMDAKACSRRCKELKITSGELDVAAQLELSKELVERQTTQDEVTRVIALFKRLVHSMITEDGQSSYDKLEGVVSFVAKVMNEYDEWKQHVDAIRGK